MTSTLWVLRFLLPRGPDFWQIPSSCRLHAIHSDLALWWLQTHMLSSDSVIMDLMLQLRSMFICNSCVRSHPAGHLECALNNFFEIFTIWLMTPRTCYGSILIILPWCGDQGNLTGSPTSNHLFWPCDTCRPFHPLIFPFKCFSRLHKG